MDTIQLIIGGMSCAHCRAAVEKALSRVPGVQGVEVDLAGGRATVRGEGLVPEPLVKAVEARGYTVREATT